MTSEQVVNSPGYRDREIDQSAPSTTGPVGIPAAVIGTSPRGPAFVPITVGSWPEWKSVFGDLDPKMYGPYAAKEWLNHRTALTYLRVLGAGANNTDGDIQNTLSTGQVKNAGVHLDGALARDGRNVGAVQFLSSKGNVSAQEAFGMPMFTDNDSFGGGTANVLRGMVLMASGARMMVLDGNAATPGAFVSNGPKDLAQVNGTNNTFKLAISSSLPSYASSDGNAGVKVFSASMDPDSPNYFAKLLNTDPMQFASRQHLLYADFAVDAEILSSSFVAVLSGTSALSQNAGAGPLAPTNFLQMYGALNTRYSNAKTTSFISQPYGATEYDLFSFETIDDGEFTNTLVKVSIVNVQASLDQSYQYGTFTVQVRAFNDTDSNAMVLESYPNCSLDPNAANYVAKQIGDRKVFYNFDATDDSEKRIVATGKYDNVSKYIRIVVADAVDRALVPATALPFGFKGMHLPKTNDELKDVASSFLTPRLSGVFTSANNISGSILPPVPFRFKVTRGAANTAPGFVGQPSPTEITNQQLCWGVKFERNDLPLNANLSSEPNALVSSYTKMLGIEQLDTLVTGSGADTFNNNKFTLAKVALSNGAVTDLTSSIKDHMKEAAYVRNAKLDTTQYTLTDPLSNNTRITLATVLSVAGASVFNRFSPFAKFTTFFHGGYDGVNFLDPNAARMNDRAASFDFGGGAEQTFVSPGLLSNMAGVGQSNSTVSSYRKAIDIMTDKMTVNSNVLTTPGMRDSFITDYGMQKVREYGLAFYVVDIPSYDDSQNRMFDDSTGRPSVLQTRAVFDGRIIDNNYAASYYPDVFIQDDTNNRRTRVPASVAVMGALAFNDRVAYPWFAPAGFNRAALDNVKNVVVRLNVSDRENLNNSRINPIATFPKSGFVIYGQKTLQVAKTSLNRVNVRRLMIEVKRIISNIANGLTFEQNTKDLWTQFTGPANAQLALIATQSGIEKFNVIMNETNNSQEDINANRLRGKVILVPTKTVETIGVDFIVTQSGITFL